MLTKENLIALFEKNHWGETRITCPDGAVAIVVPCSDYGEVNLDTVVYFLLYWDVPWSGCDSLDELVERLNDHAFLLAENTSEKERLQAYYEEHIAPDGGCQEDWDWYSDWYKDVYGHRPRNRYAAV